VSNALQKYRDMTMANGFIRRLLVMWLWWLIMAVAGDYVDLKAN